MARLLIISLLLFFLPPAHTLLADNQKKIRVSVLENIDSIELSIRDGYEIRVLGENKLLDKGGTFFNKKIVLVSKGIAFRGKVFSCNAISIKALKEPSIYLNRRLYRGSLEIIKTKQSGLIAVNIVDLEDYLKGVLYHEVSHRWPIEAIKAQAIASRTYALYQAQENSHRHYHLYSDIGSQVYNGVYAERFRTNKAVDDTRGRVLLWKGSIVPAFFHACCAGATENSGSLWKVDIPPLKGVKCPYCHKSPYFYWNYDIGLDAFREKLRKANYVTGPAESIEILKKNNSGRVESIVVKTDKTSYVIKAKDLRNLIGPGFIRSTNFEVRIENKKVCFQGKGWGHGVGMCQWGAFAMAKKKKSAEDILSFYYPGADISTFK
jgi:stage II sporulation protein D